MQRTTNSIRAALLLSLLFAAGCSLRNAKESAIRLAANALRQSVFCMQSNVPLTQSTFKPSPIAVKAAAPAARPAQFDFVATEHRDLRIEGPVDLQTVTCPIERRRLLGLGLLRTL
jgi:hypothetical protein